MRSHLAQDITEYIGSDSIKIRNQVRYQKKDHAYSSQVLIGCWHEPAFFERREEKALANAFSFGLDAALENGVRSCNQQMRDCKT